MRNFIKFFLLLISFSAFGFTDGISYSIHFKPNNKVELKNLKYMGKDIYTSSKEERNLFLEKLCGGINGEPNSSGFTFEVMTTGQDGQIFKTEPFGIPVKYIINNPMAIMENGELIVRKVEGEIVHTLFPEITCNLNQSNSWF